jgi:hypothetical protein
MTCRTSAADHAAYANRPRTSADIRKTAEIIKHPSVEIREAYHRGLEKRDELAALATARVKWTVRPATADALMLGVAVGVLIGVAARPLPVRDLPLLCASFVFLAVGAVMAWRVAFSRKARS